MDSCQSIWSRNSRPDALCIVYRIGYHTTLRVSPTYPITQFIPEHAAYHIHAEATPTPQYGSSHALDPCLGHTSYYRGVHHLHMYLLIRHQPQAASLKKQKSTSLEEGLLYCTSLIYGLSSKLVRLTMQVMAAHLNAFENSFLCFT